MLPITDILKSAQQGIQQSREVAGDRQRDAQLRQVCDQFEAMFAAELFKQTFRNTIKTVKFSDNPDEDEDSGPEAVVTDLVRSQMAKYMGSQRLLGISDQLYQQLKPLIATSTSGGR
ncbi:MAG: hypothetical protein D6820_05230 [Lentisphaerae bacterium]|nr:MAG: hypothetical protein D6820_05230 [Lentisphaerota bacterium]